MSLIKISVTLGAALYSCIALSAQAESDGIIEGGSARLLLRNYYFNRDFRDTPSDKQSYREEWAQGVMAFYSSGYTPGPVGLGFDVYALLGLKLDSGRGTSGTGLLPLGERGRAEDNYSSTGAALKVQISSTQLRFGRQQVDAPVFSTADSRLLPETATGLLVSSQEWDSLRLELGHFTAEKKRNSTNSDDELIINYGSGQPGGSIDFVGGAYTFSKHLSATFYTSRLENTWRQHYANVNWVLPLSAKQSVSFDMNVYHTSEMGKALQGQINNTTYSLAGTYQRGPHRVMLAFQNVDGDTPFDYVGGDSIFLANSITYSDFNGAEERSYQLRYDIDLSAVATPGLSLMGRYVYGDHIDGSNADAGGGYVGLQSSGGRHWERNFEVRYVVQEGPAKDLSVRLRQATHRANAAQGEGDIDEVKVIFEYPLQIL
ncbi:OprD family porin [Pseudomonas sp. M2(2023)]|uniref:OprD family porin n=1 Tax=Pseudomonas sp. M2(2023) TaxID=3049084 RepID=UPI00255411C9|nr:OprD family porin [Pseudomonas sp. M2(2023)]WIV24067.1 OprD family porin [Pseudomonas sp. M2(2023)]